MITNSLKKTKTWRSEKYLSFVRSRPCVITGSDLNVVAHHVRCLGGGGMGLKPPDYYCIPITAEEHSKLHATGERSYWERHRENPESLVTMTMLCYLATKPSDDFIEKLASIVTCT